VIVSLIVAMDLKRGIGKDNRLPWHLSDDLQQFKRLTMGHHLVMGRKTYESIGKALPGRTTIVLTHQRDYHPESCLVAHSLEAALSIARQRGETEVFVIGGGHVFAQALPLADRIYLTQVQAEVEADVFFPVFDESKWIEREHSFNPVSDKNDYPFSFRILERS
jgi:dihydrofolate reductase